MPSILPDIPASKKKIETEVTELNPYTQYKFRAIGVNSLGEGVPSKASREYSAILPFYKLTLFVI